MGSFDVLHCKSLNTVIEIQLQCQHVESGLIKKKNAVYAVSNYFG